MKENNLPNGISPLDSELTKEKNADIALKEIFANELYKHLSILTISKPQPEQKNIIQQTKENISRTFVPDAVTHIAVSKKHLRNLLILVNFMQKQLKRQTTLFF